MKVIATLAASALLVAGGSVCALYSNALAAEVGTYEPANLASHNITNHSVWVAADPPLSPQEVGPPTFTPSHIGSTVARTFATGRWQYETKYEYSKSGWKLLRYSVDATSPSQLPPVRKQRTLAANCGTPAPRAQTNGLKILRPLFCGGGTIPQGAPGPDDIPKPPTNKTDEIYYPGKTVSWGTSNWQYSGYSVSITWVWVENADGSGGHWEVKHFETTKTSE